MAGLLSEHGRAFPSSSFYEELSISNPKLAEGLLSVITMKLMTLMYCRGMTAHNTDFMTLSFLLT